MKVIAIVLGMLGGIIGLYSAISALVMVGADPAYGARLWAAWLALLLAVVAGGAALLIRIRLVAASFTMGIAGLAGFACINLFYINTFYGLAVPLWIAGAALALISTRTVAAYRSSPKA